MAASTGSPASRRSTKLTPLTTRPSLTSRQGMTRTLNMDELLRDSARVADQRQRGSRIKPAVIQRAASNRPGELPGARLQHRLHILDRGKAARGNDGNRDRLRQCD